MTKLSGVRYRTHPGYSFDDLEDMSRFNEIATISIVRAGYNIDVYGTITNSVKYRVVDGEIHEHRSALDKITKCILLNDTTVREGDQFKVYTFRSTDDVTQLEDTYGVPKFDTDYQYWKHTFSTERPKSAVNVGHPPNACPLCGHRTSLTSQTSARCYNPDCKSISYRDISRYLRYCCGISKYESIVKVLVDKGYLRNVIDLYEEATRVHILKSITAPLGKKGKRCKSKLIEMFTAIDSMNGEISILNFFNFLPISHFEVVVDKEESREIEHCIIDQGMIDLFEGRADSFFLFLDEAMEEFAGLGDLRDLSLSDAEDDDDIIYAYWKNEYGEAITEFMTLPLFLEIGTVLYSETMPLSEEQGTLYYVDLLRELLTREVIV